MSTHANVEPETTHSREPVHASEFPQTQRGAPPPAEAHALARVASQLKPQPLQFSKELSSRPFVPAVTERFTHDEPQQRCCEAQDGEQVPELPPSRAASTEPSSAVPVHMPTEHVCPSAQTLPHEPQLFGSALTGVQTDPPVAVGQATWNPVHAAPPLRLLSLQLEARTTTAQNERRIFTDERVIAMNSRIPSWPQRGSVLRP